MFLAILNSLLTICQCTDQNSVLKYEQANINVKNVNLIYFLLFMCGMKYVLRVNSKSTIKLIEKREKIMKKTLFTLTHKQARLQCCSYIYVCIYI